MIERLMNLERPYGEPEYSKLAEQINQLKQQLCGQLDPIGKGLLEQLADTCVRQETAILRDAFENGFWTAIELMMEFQKRKML